MKDLRRWKTTIHENYGIKRSKSFLKMLIDVANGDYATANEVRDFARHLLTSIVDGYSSEMHTSIVLSRKVDYSLCILHDVDMFEERPRWEVDGEIENGKRFVFYLLQTAISNLKLQPSRFGICQKPECKKFYYQPTARTRTYCSEWCSNIMRQRRYVERKG